MGVKYHALSSHEYESAEINEDDLSGNKVVLPRILVLAVFINSVSTRWTVKVQVFFLSIKMATLIALILMGTIKMILKGSGNFEKPFQTSVEFSIFKVPSAFFSAYFAYGGCLLTWYLKTWKLGCSTWCVVFHIERDNISNITEEVKKPAKTIMSAMTISFVCVTIMYLLANIAYVTVLTPEEIMSSDAVAALFAVRIIGKWSFIIWVCVVLSAAGNLSGSTYSNSRIFFVAARAGHFPFILSTIHIRRKTPLPAIIITVPFTLLVIWSGNIWNIIDFVGCFSQILHALMIAIVPYLRWTQPDRELSYKAPLWASFLYIGFTTVLVLMSVYTNPIQILISSVVVCIALIFYGLIQLLNRSDRAQSNLKPFNDCLQKIFLSVKQELKTY